MRVELTGEDESVTTTVAQQKLIAGTNVIVINVIYCSSLHFALHCGSE